MAGETIGSVNVEIGADLDPLAQQFSAAQQIIEKASEKMGSALAPAGDAADGATAPMEGLGEAIKMMAEASVEQTKTMQALATQMEAMGQVGEFLQGVFTGAAQGLAEMSEQAARAGRDGAAAIEQVPKSSEHAKGGLTGLLGTFREFRSEQMKQSRMARFFTNELLSVVPASAEAKAGISGFMGVMIEGAAGGLSFGLALEVAKFALEKLNEHFNRDSERAREWAQVQAEITRNARDAWKRFYEAMEPQTRTQEAVRGLSEDVQKRIDALVDKVRDQQMLSGWQKFWSVITPGEDYIDNIERYTQQIIKLKEQQKGLANTPEAQKALAKEQERFDRDTAQERITIQRQFQNEKVRIETETANKIADLQKRTPEAMRGQEYLAMQGAILKEGTERATRAEEAQQLALRQIRLREAAVTASDVGKIELAAQSEIEAQKTRLRQANRVGNTDEAAQARARIQLIKDETAERVRLAEMQQEQAHREAELKAVYVGTAAATQEELQYRLASGKLANEIAEAARRKNAAEVETKTILLGLLRQEHATKVQILALTQKTEEAEHALAMQSVWARDLDALRLQQKQEMLRAEAELTAAFLANDQARYDAAARKIELLSQQHARQTADAYAQGLQPVADAFQTVFDEAIVNQRKFSDVAVQIMKQMASQIFAMVMKQAVQQITANAAVTATEGAKATAGTPVVGPAMAIGAMSMLFAAVIGMLGKLPSARGGWDVPAGFNGIVKIHEQEMILPRKYAETVRRGGAGGSGPVTIFAMDGASVERVLTDNDGEFQRAQRKAQRRRSGP